MLTVGAGFLLALAAAVSLQLHDDSFAHFVRSIQHVAGFSWNDFVLDTWNRPLPTLIYGIVGQLGIFPARAASVALVVAMAYCVHRSAQTLWGTKFPAIATLAFVLAQSALLTHAHLTMTEQLAASFLGMGLFLILSGRFYLGAVLWGLMPLARAETVLFLAWLSLCVLWLFVQRHGLGEACRKIIPWGIFAWAPFGIWWVSGFLIKGELGWMTPGYVYLRSFPPDSFWLINGFSGLPSALQAPLIFLSIVGLCGVVSGIKSRETFFLSNLPLWGMALGCILIHLVFVSLVVVYPRSSGWADIGLAAINYRNYVNIAPLLALLVYGGAHMLLSAVPMARRVRFAALLATLLLLIAFWLFHWRLKFGPDWIIAAWCVVQGGFALLAYWCFWPPRGKASFAWLKVAGVCLLAGFLSYPFYWYPLRFQDRAEIMHRELGAWLQQNEPKPWPRIIQDLSGSGASEWLWDVEPGSTLWSYPAQFGRRIAAAAPGTLIVLETDSSGVPLGKYPRDLVQVLQAPGFEMTAIYLPDKPLGRLEYVLTNFSRYNKLTGWIIFRKDIDTVR